MNKNLLLYGALGFLVVRYLMKQRQTAAAAPIVSLPLPTQSREQQFIEVIPVTPPVNTRPTDNNGGGAFTNPNQNNPNSGGPGGGRPGQL
jgi:hypothetical protein